MGVTPPENCTPPCAPPGSQETLSGGGLLFIHPLPPNYCCSPSPTPLLGQKLRLSMMQIWACFSFGCKRSGPGTAQQLHGWSSYHQLVASGTPSQHLQGLLFLRYHPHPNPSSASPLRPLYLIPTLGSASGPCSEALPPQ